MFIGCPLFDTYEKFVEWYSFRLKKCYAEVYEDVLLFGASLKKVRRLIYDKS